MTSFSRHGKVVVGYMGSWAVYREGDGSFAINNIDPGFFTHLIYCFAGLDENTHTIKSLDPWRDLRDDGGKGGYEEMTALKRNHPHLKILLAIGGWNEGSTKYSSMASDAGRRSNFISSVTQLLLKFNFDGLDLDWEYPAQRGGSPSDKSNFVVLAKELRAAFTSHNLLLTAALGAGPETIKTSYNVKALATHLDFFHMMCYDYHSSSDGRIGANAPLASPDNIDVKSSINQMLQLGAPANKLVLGVPLYGRSFLAGGSTAFGAPAQGGFGGPLINESGMVGYNEICQLFKQRGWRAEWDEGSFTPVAINGNKVISYDDARSVEEKVKFAMRLNLAGVMVWSVEMDDFRGVSGDKFPLMKKINEAIQNN